MRAWRNTYILNSINQKLPLTVRSNIIIQLVSALYPPQLWAWEPDADEHDDSRTTNAAEAFPKCHVRFTRGILYDPKGSTLISKLRVRSSWLYADRIIKAKSLSATFITC